MGTGDLYSPKLDPKNKQLIDWTPPARPTLDLSALEAAAFKITSKTWLILTSRTECKAAVNSATVATFC